MDKIYTLKQSISSNIDKKIVLPNDVLILNISSLIKSDNCFLLIYKNNYQEHTEDFGANNLIYYNGAYKGSSMYDKNYQNCLIRTIDDLKLLVETSVNSEIYIAITYKDYTK